MTTNLDLLSQLVRNRDALRDGFTQVQPRLTEDLAGAALALSDVNAGPACIQALWQAAIAVPPDQLHIVSFAGHAAADICRYAGARAALPCLEALPTIIRLTKTDATFIWQGLNRLSREAPASVPDIVRRIEKLLATGNGIAFADFIAAGLKATTKDPVRRSAFFTLDDPLAQVLLQRQATPIGFAESERMLSAFIAGLWGIEPRLKSGPSQRRTLIASGTVLLPPVFAGAAPERTRTLYRAAAAHAYAHLMVPTVSQAVGTLKSLQIVLIGLIEDARVEALAIRRFPGLGRLWSEFHVAEPSGAKTAAGLLARLSRALLDTNYVDADGFVAKGRALFNAAPLEDPAISRQIGGLLGNDLGQMRLQFNAKTYVTEPAYRDDNMHLWELPEAPDDALSMTVDTARGSGDGGTQSDGSGGAPKARDAGLDEKATLLATYPEWDAAGGVERPDWTSLRDTVPQLGATAPRWAGEANLRNRIAGLIRGTFIGHRIRQPAQDDGEELDIDAAINATIARRSGLQPDGRIYRDRRPRSRDLATLIILDVSQSTAAIGPAGLSVLAAQRLAVEALSSALEARGDLYALRGFASAGRDDVRLTRLKDFDESLSEIVSARLAGLSPGLSTRLGAALRHSGSELAPLRTTRKLVLVLTDGEPSDIDVPNPSELVEDARRAVRTLRLQGIDVFGIVMDPEDAGSGAAIFGRHNTIAVRRLEELPARLAGLYFRLALR